MGTNRRYPGHGAQLAEERAVRQARTHGPLHTLTDEQLRLGLAPVTVVPDATHLWGLAWVQFGDVDVRCTVRIRRWTEQAVGVEVDVDGDILRCWVWQGTCTRLDRREDAWG